MTKLKSLLAVAIVALAGSIASAQDCCCDHCGCNCARPICVIKCETKKVPKVTYTCECEDFCIPGPSKKCGSTCTTDCCGDCHYKINWLPQCGCVRNKTKLYKHVEEEEEKVYKWVVEYVCDSCAANGCCCGQDGEPCANNRPERESFPVVMEAPKQQEVAPAQSKPVQNVSFLQSIFSKKNVKE